jgi:hypothetical protein
MTTIVDLFARLSGDTWRVSHQFSEDLLQANALLHNSAATEGEMAECAALWCLRKQPCQFGRVAASAGRLHFCFLTEQAVAEWSDEEIAEKIGEEKQLWKQRAAIEPFRGAHSFLLVVASPRVALAAPDQNLRAFSDRLLELAGWEADRRGARRKNTVTSDFLYLKHPTDGSFYGFRFNADFFACAGDGRWWHDHRFPGGIAFTANSTGHMIAVREWYLGKEQGRAWALKQAMLTIDNAMRTLETESAEPSEQGRATWLRSLDSDGKPLVTATSCPLAKIPTALEGKDWTRYEGVLHTDHAVREEFFLDRKVAPTASKPYLMDFTYLYDEKQDDFIRFTGGQPFTAEQVFAEIGRPEDWTRRASKATPLSRSHEQAIGVAEQLQACRRWEAAFSVEREGGE